MIVYTVTTIDLTDDVVLGVRRTPAIFTTLHDATYAVKNNELDLADGGTYQYAVIEETLLNTIRPHTQDNLRLWFVYNAITDEFESINVVKIPTHLSKLYGFGIG
jgi:hypothetical protein